MNPTMVCLLAFCLLRVAGDLLKEARLPDTPRLVVFPLCILSALA